jgi:hypothetical protein
VLLTAGIKVNLVNRASASIYWVAEGAIGIGAGGIIKGTLLSHNFAVAVGAESFVEGRMLTAEQLLGQAQFHSCRPSFVNR